jgi:hypothetical protein
MVEYLSFLNSSLFCLKILFNVNGKGHRVLCTPCYGSQASKQTNKQPPFFSKRKIAPWENLRFAPEFSSNILTLSNFIHQIFIHLVSVFKNQVENQNPIPIWFCLVNQNWKHPNKRGNFQTQFLCYKLEIIPKGTYHIIS